MIATSLIRLEIAIIFIAWSTTLHEAMHISTVLLTNHTKNNHSIFKSQWNAEYSWKSIFVGTLYLIVQTTMDKTKLNISYLVTQMKSVSSVSTNCCPLFNSHYYQALIFQGANISRLHNVAKNKNFVDLQTLPKYTGLYIKNL